ncbi:MAG TPA: SH3 domain-containing protein [Candidatus Ozemobacteraceae bacterium]|nr:SH3 domain-containing protein [Candidatus Ozemobacteraceae bacterium]
MRGYKWPAILFATLFLTGVLWAMQVPSAGKVNCSALNVRTGPGTNYTIVTVIYQGDSVSIVDVVGNWYQINFQGSTNRYVYKSYIDVTSYTEVSDDEAAKRPTTTLGTTDPKRPESATPDLRSLPRNDF